MYQQLYWVSGGFGISRSVAQLQKKWKHLFYCCMMEQYSLLQYLFLTFFHDLVFQGRHGRAFLFSHAMNIVVGPKEDRQLLTGLHTVADIYCGDCREVLGWKYERAYVATQKYKEGKFIIEKSKIVKENWQPFDRVTLIYLIVSRIGMCNL